MTVPVILLTGFLGSGKTSLLNGLLDARKRSGQGQGGKLAILVNELGSIGIDGSLLPKGSAQQVELPGGCVCCSLDENLEESLSALLDSQPELEMIVIETTGIAEPLPILWTLSGDPLGDRVRVAAVVTVVDGLEHERHRPMAPAVDNQVEHADVLLVSKLDVIGADADARMAELEPILRQANDHAPIFAEKSPEDLARALLGILADPDRPLPARPVAPVHDHGPRHEIVSEVVPIPGIVDFEELTAQLEELPAEYIRIKGICRAVDESTGSDQVRLIAFHRVGARVSSALLDPDERDFEHCMVALGLDLDRERLTACIAAAVLPSM